MKTRIWIGPTLALGLTMMLACEESTSGADFPNPNVDGSLLPELDASTAVDARPAANDGGLTEPGIELPACLACAASNCETSLAACGEPCLAALTCAEACDTPVCRERCLREQESVELTTFKTCYLTRCLDDCVDVQATLTGVQLYAKNHCAAYNFCAPGSLQFYYGSIANCEQAIASYYIIAATLPGSGVSLTTLAACSSIESGLTCADFLSSRLGVACQIQGRKALNEPCMEDSQCESSFCPGPDRACAVCKPMPSFNEPCADENRCAPGLVCNTTEGRCVSIAPLGGACNANAICELGDCRGGICQPRGIGGDSCNPAGGVYCNFARGFTCSGGTCVPFVAETEGGSCTPVAGRVSTCQNLAACQAGRCTAPPKLDEPCDDENGPYCTWPNTCRDGTCVGFSLPYPCE